MSITDFSSKYNKEVKKNKKAKAFKISNAEMEHIPKLERKIKLIRSKNCIKCGNCFEYCFSNKKYCSKKCEAKVRKIITMSMAQRIATGFVHGRPLNEYFYFRYKKSAEKRGNTFAITQYQFDSLMGGKCHYCGVEIKHVGIDRMDNNIGYFFYNCVRCCTQCNLMKRASSYQQFINQCKKISNWQEKKNKNKIVCYP